MLLHKIVINAIYRFITIAYCYCDMDVHTMCSTI
jgi:hypothetical protein